MLGLCQKPSSLPRSTSLSWVSIVSSDAIAQWLHLNRVCLYTHSFQWQRSDTHTLAHTHRNHYIVIWLPLSLTFRHSGQITMDQIGCKYISSAYAINVAKTNRLIFNRNQSMPTPALLKHLQAKQFTEPCTKQTLTSNILPAHTHTHSHSCASTYVASEATSIIIIIICFIII